MAIKTHKVTLSLDNPRVIQSGINVQSFDKQSIQISIELTKNDGFFRVPSDATIRVSLLKLTRQEQKIIVDVPNTNRDSIDWIVPDYLDGYQGTVRVGVYLVSGAENVDLGYFTILSNVSDIDKMADEFTDNVFQGWEQIEADLNELNLTIAQTKLDLAEDLTQVDNTIANVNTLASDFTTDVATKQADVTSKYNAFDTDITEANQTIDDILALQPQFQSVLDETTGKDVISAPEIILARGGATTLGERLDSDKAEVTAQLAQTTEGIKEMVSTNVLNVNENIENRCVVTFIDDDATTETYTRLLPIFQSKNVPFGSAVITGYVGNAGFMNLSQIKEGHNNGMEILSHTVNHYNLAGLSESEVDYELRESKQWLIDNGFENESFVYPQSGYNRMTRKKVKAYYDYAFGDNGFNDKGFLDNSRIKRVAFGSWTGGNTPVNENTELDTYNYYKECVDYAVSTKSLLVFMIHVKQQPIEQDAILAEIIDYIKSLSVPILKPSDAYREKGNKFAVGDLDEKYLFIGETDTATNLTASIYESLNGRTNASSISAFKKGFVTISDVSNADVAGFPDDSGYLETYRTILNFEGYSFQIFHPIATSNQKTFRRVWSTATGAWGVWTWLEGEANPVVRLGTNAVTSSTDDTFFANGKITYTLVTSAGATGFPRNTGGTLVVDKIVNNNGYRKHLYHIYNTGETWERFVKSDGSYGSWLRQGGSTGTTAKRPVDAFVGYQYFDSTLGKPVWLKTVPSTWVDATGAIV